MAGENLETASGGLALVGEGLPSFGGELGRVCGPAVYLGRATVGLPRNWAIVGQLRNWARRTVGQLDGQLANRWAGTAQKCLESV